MYSLVGFQFKKERNYEDFSLLLKLDAKNVSGEEDQTSNGVFVPSLGE